MRLKSTLGLGVNLLLMWFPTAASPAVPTHENIELLAASAQGDRVALVTQEVVEKERQQQVWLKSGDEPERVILTYKQLKGINYAYTARVVKLLWSPSGRFLAISVHDGDVSIVSAVYDAAEAKHQILDRDILEPGLKSEHPSVQDSSDAQWHPTEDILFFRAEEVSRSNHVLYRYDPSSKTAQSVHLRLSIRGYQPTANGLVLLVHGPGDEPDRIEPLPYSQFRQSEQ